MSATYRQSAVHADPKRATELDATNRLLWHMAVRRLDAEQIRDAALGVSGELDLTEGGPSVDGDQPRRSIYTKVLRNRRNPLLEVFDGPDGFSSAPQRNTTTTPLQSLLLINGEWMLERASAMAERLTEQAGPAESDRINLAYKLVLGRPATACEESEAEQFLRDQQHAATESKNAPHAAWVDFCHVLLNSNEFLYID